MDEPQSILEAGRQLIQLRKGRPGAAAWRQATERFSTALRESRDGALILQLLEEDAEDDLPIAEKTAGFERLLELGPRTPRVLRMFAHHLWFHGPESDDLAERLKAEADALESGGTG